MKDPYHFKLLFQTIISLNCIMLYKWTRKKYFLPQCGLKVFCVDEPVKSTDTLLLTLLLIVLYLVLFSEFSVTIRLSDLWEDIYNMISVLLQGGLKAVVWVDAFQAIIMFGSLLTIVVKASTFSQPCNEKMFFIIKF